MSEAHPLPLEQRHLPVGRLWFGFASPAVAWVCHEMLSFFISWQTCQDGDGDWGFLSGMEVRVLLLALTATALGIAIAAGIVSLANWHKLSKEAVAVAEATGREQFMSMGGVFFSVIFSVGIVWGGMGPLLVGVCETAK